MEKAKYSYISNNYQQKNRYEDENLDFINNTCLEMHDNAINTFTTISLSSSSNLTTLHKSPSASSLINNSISKSNSLNNSSSSINLSSSNENKNSPPPESSNRKIIIIGGVMLFTTIGLFFLNQHGIKLYMDSFLYWVKSIGLWGNFLFSAMFIIISFPFILGGYIPLALGAGALYGIVIGTLTISIGSTLGACLTFWMSRAIGRRWVEKKVKQTKEFRLFKILLQGDNQFLVTFLIRMAPIPFGLQNSFFAMTSISFRDYFMSTFIGLLPCQIIWTHLGTTLRNLSKINSGELELTAFQKLSLAFQILILFVLVGYFMILSKRMKEKDNQEMNNRDDLELQNVNDVEIQEIGKSNSVLVIDESMD